MRLDLGQAVDLDTLGRFAGIERGRRAQFPALTAFDIDQIIFELARHDRRQAVSLVTVEDALQDVARVEVVGCAVELIQRQHDLADIVAQPRRRHQGSRNRPRHAVGVTVFPDQPGLLDIGAQRIDDQDRARQEAAVFVDRQQLMTAQALAARHPRHRGEEDLEINDMRIGFEESFRFLNRSDHGVGCKISGTCHRKALFLFALTLRFLSAIGRLMRRL